MMGIGAEARLTGQDTIEPSRRSTPKDRVGFVPMCRSYVRICRAKSMIYFRTIGKESGLGNRFSRALTVLALPVFMTGLAICCAAGSLWAHHSPSAEFDMTKRFILTGTLTKVDWINPHIVVNVDAKADGGKMENWRFESNPPSWFRRVGVARAEI